MCRCLTRRRALGLLAGLAALPLAGCFEGNQTGPVEVHWDRDTCELCQMMISDARFVAQVRGGPRRKVYKFDDIGCAVSWLNEKPWAGDEETEIWIAEINSTRENVNWLNAREAYYFTGEMTPMNYGFSAVTHPNSSTIDFVELTNRILADAPNHICAPRRDDS